ncbi:MULTISPECIES: hypothetical protein [Metabacillus]|uniref:hypothetical protein n=1 Tax=Metabacillus TaxID=2675233 RepID=UPI001BA3C1C7|nr:MULTISPECIES: hypothetical protein [Metabacillus]MCM3164065.1 hypothetical protein [Metabacillus litoralis]UGB33534.1 hypothetical protein LPC09_26690 [Metabacillus sp. B2-18]
MKLSIVSTIITTIVIPVIIPFISVWFAFIITKKHNEREYLNDQKVQRIKLLTLLRKEAELFKDYRYHNNTHRSKEFVTIKLVFNSPAFNVDQHGRLIELALEMERINQNIDISVKASTGILSASLGGYLSNLSTGNPIMALSNSRLMKLLTGKKHVEHMGEGLNKMFEKNIQDSTKEALPIIDEIIKEVDKLISNERQLN